MDHTVTHFELPADDVAKLKSFYSSLFGWQISRTDVPVPDEMDYNMAMTVPMDDKGNLVRNGVNGAIYKKQDPNSKLTIYIQVESIDEYAKKVEELGGKIVAPKTEIPSVGWSAHALDPEGNLFGIFEEMPKSP